jgi:hypothetical protein
MHITTFLIASTKYPSLMYTALMININYTVIPPEYSVVPLAEYKAHLPLTKASANDEACNEALIERARDNPGNLTIIQNKIVNGQGLQLVLTVVLGAFGKMDQMHGMKIWMNWRLHKREVDSEEDNEDDKEREDEDSEYSGRQMDEVDVIMARMILNTLLQKMGHSPAF